MEKSSFINGRILISMAIDSFLSGSEQEVYNCTSLHILVVCNNPCDLIVKIDVEDGIGIGDSLRTGELADVDLSDLSCSPLNFSKRLHVNKKLCV